VCRAFRGAEDEVRENILLLENHWNRLRIQLEFIRGISYAFDEHHARIQQDLLLTLQTKLSAATSGIEAAVGNSTGIRRVNYLFMRKTVERLMADLDSWQKVFDPTWFLIIRISSPLVDSGIQNWKTHTSTAAQITQPQPLVPGSRSMSGATLIDSSPIDTLHKLRHIQLGSQRTPAVDAQYARDLSVNLDTSGLEDAVEMPIPFTTSKVIRRPRSSKLLVVETIPSPRQTAGGSEQTDPIFVSNVENLARQLKQLEPGSCGLLRCYGTVKRRVAKRRLAAIDMVFRTPDDSQEPPCTLRQILLERQAPSLTQTLKLAKQVARAVSFFHACDFVHKSIRPENVLVFAPSPQDQSSLGSSFLVGYEQLRHAFFQTNMRGDSFWHRNLYRHPQRQGILAPERYMMQHDIYSLGVVLLEIGLWHSFVRYHPRQEASAALRPVLTEDLGLLLPKEDTQVVHDAETAMLNKETLVQLARDSLPPRTGDIYAGVVLACLTCLDPGNDMFGDEESLRDEDGVLVGVRFIERILMELDRICV